MAKTKQFLPEPIYLNQKDAAEYIHVSPDILREFAKQGLIHKCPREGSDFRYKIKEFVALAEAIDLGQIVIPNRNKSKY